MHFMTDRSPTLLFNIQTQNLALGGIGILTDGIDQKAMRRRPSGWSAASSAAGSTCTEPQKALRRAGCPWIVRG